MSQNIPVMRIPRGRYESLSLSRDVKSSIKVRLRRYNELVGFVDRSLALEQPARSAKAVADTVLEIEKILALANEAIEEKVHALELNVELFSKDVALVADPKWYRKAGDITGARLPYKLDNTSADSSLIAKDEVTLSDMLKMMHIPDPADFALYLQDLLPQAAMQPRHDNEYGGFPFASKMRLLLNRVLQDSRSDYSIALRLFIVVKAKVLIKNKQRFRRSGFEREKQYIDDTLFWLLKQHDESSPERRQYWDFAASWRELVNAWQDIETEPEVLLRLLGGLRQKAWSEVRWKTELAVQSRLPTELVDAVFEEAMLAEEIPIGDD